MKIAHIFAVLLVVCLQGLLGMSEEDERALKNLYFKRALQTRDRQRVNRMLYNREVSVHQEIPIGSIKRTPLEYAVRLQSPDLICTLITHGASIDASTLPGLCQWKNQGKVSEVLSRNPHPITSLTRSTS